MPATAVRFIVITFLASWALLGGAWALDVPWQGANMVLLAVPLMWIPGAVGLFLQRRATPGRVRDVLRLRCPGCVWWETRRIAHCW